MPRIEWNAIEPGDILVNGAGHVREVVTINYEAGKILLRWRWWRYGQPRNERAVARLEHRLHRKAFNAWLGEGGGLLDAWVPQDAEAWAMFQAYQREMSEPAETEAGYARRAALKREA